MGGIPQRSYVQLETGLNFWDGTEWKPSIAEFGIDGSWAVATNGQHKVALYSNANAEGAVVVNLPDGQRLRSHVIGLGYRDISSGVSGLIAEPLDSQALVFDGGVVLYTNSFNGIAADLRYTYTKAGFEQDLILRGPLPPPEEFGLNPASTRLEVWTEFSEAPEPGIPGDSLSKSGVRRVGEAKADSGLEFGTMSIVPGRTFREDEPDTALSLVSKEWIRAEDGRRFLVEGVPVQTVLSEVPKSGSGGASLWKRSEGRLNTLNFPKRKDTQQAALPVRRASREVAQLDSNRSGVVVDYLLLSTGQTNFVFKAASTYHVTGAIDLRGTNTTFGAGVVIKFAKTNSPTLRVHTPVTWEAMPYRPVVLTGFDDISVGEILQTGLITNNPVTGTYATTALEFNVTNHSLTLQNLHVRHAGTAVRINGGTNHQIWHAQFVNSLVGIRSESSTFALRNALFHNVTTNFFGSASTGALEHLSVNTATWFNCSNLLTLTLKNSILGGVTSAGTYTGTSNYVTATPSSVFQQGGAGANYLIQTATATVIDKGTTSVDALLLDALKIRTTQRPATNNNGYSANVTLSSVVARDSNTPDLGYHYDPIDYMSRDIYVTNATLVITNRTVLARYGFQDVSDPLRNTMLGITLFEDANICIEGSPNEPARFTHVSSVQELSTIPGPAIAIDGYDGRDTGLFFNLYQAGAVGIRHASFDAVSGKTQWLPLWQFTYAGGERRFRTLTVRDCSFFGDSIDGQFNNDSAILPKIRFINNSYEGTSFDYSQILFSGSADIELRNNLIRNAFIMVEGYPFANGFTARQILTDNAFQDSQLTDEGYLPAQRTNNAYINSTRFNSWTNSETASVTLSSFSYQTKTNALGMIGRFYHGSTNLQNLGSRTASAALLGDYTTLSAQTKDSGTVDIGFHYVAMGTNGLPSDADSDGAPDYFENRVGNCYCEGSLPSFTISLTRPTNGQTFVFSPTNVVFQSSLSGSISAVEKVQYYQGSTLLGESTMSTNGWYFPWESVASGTKTGLFARAVDCDCGVTASSSSISIINNALPAITWVAPTGTTTNTYPGSITLRVTATDSDGGIASVQFFDGLTNSPLVTLTSANDGANGYKYVWTNIAARKYPMYVKVTDSSGAVRLSETRLLVVNPVNLYPEVSVISPTNGAKFKAWSDVIVTAKAYDASGVAKVDFYSGTNLLSSDPSGFVSGGTTNFTTTLWGLSHGTYSIAARATDAASPGLSKRSTLVTFTVAEEEPTTINGFWDPVFASVANFQWGPQIGSAVRFDSTGDLYYGGYEYRGAVNSKMLKYSNCNWSSPYGQGNAGAVYALLAHGTNLYMVGHDIELYAPNPTRYFVAMRSGTNMIELGNGLGFDEAAICVPRKEQDPGVRAIHISGGDAYIGGDFISAGGNTNIQRFAKLAAGTTNWIGVGSTILNGSVQAITEFQGRIYAGGNFTAAGSNTNVKYLAMLTNGVWSPVGTGPNGPVYALAVHNDRLFVGGDFNEAGGKTNANCLAIWNGLVWTPVAGGLGNGTQDEEYPCFMTNRVAAIAARGNSIFVTGEFRTAWNDDGPIAVNYIARADWNDALQTWRWSALGEGLDYADDGGYDPSMANGADLAIHELSDGSGYEVVVTGLFNRAGGMYANQIARWICGKAPCSITGPSIAISQPLEGAVTSVDPQFVSLATASGTNTIERVEFYLDGTLLGEALYSGINWYLDATGVSAGTHSIRATAFEDGGKSSASAPINFRVGGPADPAVGNNTYTNLSTGAVTNLYVLGNDSGTGPLRVLSVSSWANPFSSSAAGSARAAYDGGSIVFQARPYAYGTMVLGYSVGGAVGTNSGLVTVYVKSPPTATLVTPADETVYSSAPGGISVSGKAWDYDGSISNVTLYVNGNQWGSPTTSTNYSFSWSTNAAGFYTLAVLVRDNEGYTNYSPSITVSYDPPGGNLPVADITNLSNDFEVSTTLTNLSYPTIRDGFFNLHGLAYDVDETNQRDTNYVSYQVLLYKTDDSEIPFANVTPGTLNSFGFKPGGDTSGSLGTLNLSAIPNGVYDLVLVVRDRGEYSIDQVRVSIVNDLKIGAFTFSEQDVVIPVNGVPLTVVRKYDSLNLTQGDFGWCWTMAINDVQATLDEERSTSEVMASLSSDVNDGSRVDFSLRTGGGRNVSLVMPDGRRANFLFRPKISVDPTKPVAWAEWTSPPGVTATLMMANVSPGSYELVQQNTINFHANGLGKPVWSYGDARTPFDAYDISGYDLRFKDGTVYELRRDPAFGTGDGDYVYYDATGTGSHVPVKPYSPSLDLKAIRQATGDRLEIAKTGVLHKTPTGGTTRSILFERDEKGRLRAIRDPLSGAAGLETVRYIYNDETGNLLQVHRLVDRTTSTYITNRYLYEHPRFTHYITSIENARGVPVTRNEYDDAGRLVAMVDASGRTNRFLHDTTNKVELVINRNGATNSLAYDARGNVIASTNAMGQVTRMGYDDVGNKLAETNALGQVSRWQYTDVLMTAAIDALGKTNSFTYDYKYRPYTSTDPLGNTTVNSWIDASGLLYTSSDSLGGMATNTYTDGLLVSSVDPIGTVTTNRYDSFGNLTNSAVVSAGGTTLSLTASLFDANNRLTNQMVFRTATGAGSPSTLSTSYWYDELGRMTHTLLPNNTTNRTVYDEIGEPVQTIDALGRITRKEYDALGNLTKIVYPDSTISETFKYDAEGRRTLHVDRGGRTNATGYDLLGRVVAVTNALGLPEQAITRTIYDTVGHVAHTVTALGVTNAVGYDAAGRRTSMTNAWGTAVQQVTQFAYDDAGNQTSVTDSLGRIMDTRYDLRSRMIQTILPAVTSGGAKTTNAVAYDAAGRKVYETNGIAGSGQPGVLKAYSYDGTGRLLAVTNGLGSTSITGITSATNWATFSYDETGNLTNQVDALGRATGYGYDSMGRRSWRNLPGGQLTAYTYDSVGNLTTRTNADNVLIRFSYDNFNRLTNQWTVVSGTSNNVATFKYTVTGRLTNRVDASGTHSWLFDNRDRLKTNTTPVGTLKYTYDVGGNQLTLDSTTSSGVSMSYAYDALGRLTNAVDNRLSSGSKNTAFGYDAAGNLAWLNYVPLGVTNAYVYDTQNRLTNLAWRTTGGSSVASFGYTVHALGMRTFLNESVNGTARTYTWSYDALSRLKSEALTGGLAGTLTYGLDLVGNRKSRTSALGLASQSLNYDRNDWLDNDSTTNNANPWFDAKGNTLTNAVSTSLGYAYDWGDRLTSGPGATNIVYDLDGNRTKKTVAGTTTHYLVATVNPTGWPQVVEEHTGSSPGTLSRVYAYGSDLIDQRQTSSGTVHFFLTDGLGSTRALLNTSGTVTDQYTYDAYGNTIASSGSSTPNRYLYTGEQWDSDLNMYYLRARYMNPNLGRLWSYDTYDGQQADPLSLHKYLYVNSNPITLTDPSGHFSLGEMNLTTGQAALLAMRAGSAAGNIHSGSKNIIQGLEALNRGDNFSGSLQILMGGVNLGSAFLSLAGPIPPPPPGAAMALANGPGLSAAERAAIMLANNPALRNWFYEHVLPHLITSAAALTGEYVSNMNDGGDMGGGSSSGAKADPACAGANGRLKRIRSVEHLGKHGWPTPYSLKDLGEFATNYILGKKGTWTLDKDGLPGYAYPGLIRGEVRSAILRPDGTWVSIH